MTVRSIEESFSIVIRLAVTASVLLVLAIGCLTYVNNYQNKVIEGQRTLIRNMMVNPNCLVPAPTPKPSPNTPSGEAGTPGVDFPIDEHVSLPDMRREGWFI